MVPYFSWNEIHLGYLTIQVWGLMVSFGFAAGIYLAYRLAKKYFLSEQVVLDLAVWILVGSFVCARLFFVLFYQFDYYYQYPVDILKIWLGGASSLGGFFGAIAAVYLFAKIRKFSWKELAPYLDILTVGTWLGWAIGRLGCFFIHDHPGRLSNFFLAVNFPEGARFDLGLVDSLLALVVFVLVAVLYKKVSKRGAGKLVVLSFLVYSFCRFWLDFLRATDLAGSDVRYWILTPMQWGILVFYGLLTFVATWRKMKQPNNGRIA